MRVSLLEAAARPSVEADREPPYRHWSVPQEVQIAVLAEQVAFGVSRVELLSSHDEVAGKIAS